VFPPHFRGRKAALLPKHPHQKTTAPPLYGTTVSDQLHKIPRPQPQRTAKGPAPARGTLFLDPPPEAVTVLREERPGDRPTRSRETAGAFLRARDPRARAVGLPDTFFVHRDTRPPPRGSANPSRSRLSLALFPHRVRNRWIARTDVLVYVRIYYHGLILFCSLNFVWKANAREEPREVPWPTHKSAGSCCLPCPSLVTM